MALALVESNDYRCCYACNARAGLLSRWRVHALPSQAPLPSSPSPLTEPHQTFAAPSPATAAIDQPFLPAFALSYRQTPLTGPIV
jgi:hypothetical protein